MPDFKKGSWLAGMLCLAAIAVYGVTIRHDFLYSWDDYYYVVYNSFVQEVSWSNLRTVFTTFFVGNYAPVHLVSLMLEHAFWGLKPAGYHLFNAVLHAGNGALAYALFRRLALPPAAALFAAAIFLFHPVQVEAVAWVAESKTLLAMFFFLLAFHGYCRYLAAGPSRRLRQYLGALAAFLLALLSKPIAVVFPAVLLLHDLCHGSEGRRRISLADKLPFLLAAAAVVMVTMFSQAQSAGGGRRGYPGGSPLAALFTMLPVLGSYLGDCLWPANLLPYYMVKIRTELDWAVLAGGGLALVLAWLGVVLWRRNRRCFFYYALFFLGLVPVSQVVPIITLKQDRYLYFPLLGLAGLAAEGACLVVDRFPRCRHLVTCALTLLVLALPILTLEQLRHWQDDLSLWSYTVKRDPDNTLGWLLLSKVQTRLGDGGQARAAWLKYNYLKENHGPLRGYEDQ